MNSTRYSLDVINEEFFQTVFANEYRINKDDASIARCISCRVLYFHICPRVGEFIMYPLLQYNPEHIKWLLHQRVALEVLEVFHNPTAVENDCDKPNGEFDIILTVSAHLKTQNY